MPADVRLLVNGRKYGGWEGVRITVSMERLVGSFDLTAFDRWGGQSEPWAIAEEDACKVEVKDRQVIEGYVDGRSIALSATQRELRFRGKDTPAKLAECSAVLDKWTFRGATVADVAEKVAAPFGIRVSVQPGLALPRPKKKIVVSPGDSAYQAIEAAARAAGVLVVSDGRGGILITRAGTARASVSLVEGKNLMGVTVDYDGTDRFHRYLVLTQVAGTAKASGRHTRVRAEATDPGVRRTDRVLVIRPEKSMTADFAKRRADWEARVRAAKAETVSAVVRGWEQRSGEDLWLPNQLVGVHSPSIGVSGEMLISQVEYSLDDGGEVTQLRLVRPDAFTPEPQAVVKTKGGRWKELDRVPGVGR